MLLSTVLNNVELYFNLEIADLLRNQKLKMKCCEKLSMGTCSVQLLLVMVASRVLLGHLGKGKNSSISPLGHSG